MQQAVWRLVKLHIRIVPKGTPFGPVRRAEQAAEVMSALGG